MDNVNGNGTKFKKSRSKSWSLKGGGGGGGGEAGETETLLVKRDGKKVSNGGIARKREGRDRGRERRRVQWKDRNGNKLFEVLEFQPSDSSDSEEDEYADSCICTIV